MLPLPERPRGRASPAQTTAHSPTDLADTPRQALQRAGPWPRSQPPNPRCHHSDEPPLLAEQGRGLQGLPPPRAQFQKRRLRGTAPTPARPSWPAAAAGTSPQHSPSLGGLRGPTPAALTGHSRQHEGSASPSSSKHRKPAGHTQDSPTHQLILPSETEKRRDIFQGRRRCGFGHRPDTCKLTLQLDGAPLALCPNPEDPGLLQRGCPTTLLHSLSARGHRRGREPLHPVCKVHEPTHVTRQGQDAGDRDRGV